MTAIPPTTAYGPPLHLTIRFSSSLPDIDLEISSPQTTTVLSLKHLLRTRIDSRSRLRLIHQGRLLSDTSALNKALKLPPSGPPRASTASHAQRQHDDPKGKGKEIVGVEEPLRIYVNCSIGDELSQEDLDAERDAAYKPPDESAAAAAAAAAKGPGGDGHGTTPVPSTRPRPRGFDRLLTSGFSTSEVATLRTQFSSIQAEHRAPSDPPPSPDTMRRLEDSWIDSNAGELPSAGAGAGSIEDELNGGMANVLDVLIRAMMIGFFFPLGSLTWLLRMGIWNDKWQIFVASGVVLSLSVGVIMGISGDR